MLQGCVLYLIKHYTEGDPAESLLRSVYVGGDVDSLAAIVLGMIGGRDGLKIGDSSGGIPQKLLSELESAE